MFSYVWKQLCWKEWYNILDRKHKSFKYHKPTKSVNQADPEHVQREQSVVHMLSSHMVHEHMIDHGAYGGGEAGQVMDHTDPGAVHFFPGDTERQQHQEKEKRDAWGNQKSGEEGVEK